MTFRHALVRDVAYEGLPYRTRRALHGQVADSILAAAGGDRSDVVALLAPHLFHAHRDVEAWTCSIEAGDRARDVFANLDAATAYERALAVARRLGDVAAEDRAGVHEALGDVQDLAGLYEHAQRSFEAAARLVGDDAARRAAVLLKAAFVAESRGRYTSAIRTVRRAIRMLDGIEGSDVDALRAKLTVWEAVVRAMQGRYREALDRARTGTEASLEVGDEPNVARALLIVDFAEMTLGRLTDLENSHRALEIYTRLGDLRGQASVTNTLGAHALLRRTVGRGGRPVRDREGGADPAR